MTGYPWATGDALLAADLNAAFANGAAIGGPFLRLSGGTVTGSGVTATTGIFGGVANPAQRTGTQTWVGGPTTGMLYYDLQSFAAFYPPTNYPIAVAGAVRASDSTSAGTGAQTANIGIASFVMADSTAPTAGNTWAFYGSNRRVAGGTATYGAELSMGNQGNTVEVNPYDAGAPGITVGLRLSSGSEAAEAGQTVNPASVAINVVSNGATWKKGLVFSYNAISDIGNGTMIAMQLATKQEMQWTFDATNTRSAFIRSDAVRSTGTGTGIIFNDTSLNVVEISSEVPRLTVGASGACNITGTLGITGGVACGGINFGSVAASGIGDLSKHLNIYGGTYGIGYYGAQLNFNVATGGSFNYVINGAAIGYINSTGMNFIAIGQTTATVGAFTTVALNAAATGPTIRAGTGAATGTQPKGSIWMRTDGAVGSTLYVTQGAGTWAAVAGV